MVNLKYISLSNVFKVSLVYVRVGFSKLLLVFMSTANASAFAMKIVFWFPVWQKCWVTIIFQQKTSQKEKCQLIICILIFSYQLTSTKVWFHWMHKSSIVWRSPILENSINHLNQISDHREIIYFFTILILFF